MAERDLILLLLGAIVGFCVCYIFVGIQSLIHHRRFVARMKDDLKRMGGGLHAP